MPTQWITIAEAADVSKYHPERVRELMRAGKVKGRKFGIVWQVDKQALLAYVRAAEKSGDSRMGPRGR